MMIWAAMRRVRGFILLSLLLTLAACAELGTQEPAPVMDYGVNGGAGSSGMHTVSAGETLWGISQSYRIPMRDIVAANDLSPPYTMSGGMRLKLPPPVNYRVRAGDTLYGISRIFNVTQTQIVQTNSLTPPYAVKPGTILRLPSVASARVTPAVAGPAVARVPVAPVVSSSSMMTATPYTPSNAIVAEELPPPTAAPSSTLVVTQIPEMPSSTETNIPVFPERVSGQFPMPTVKPAIASPESGKVSFMWPVKGRVISSYGPKKEGLHNDGLNIAAPRGASVKAAESGTVVYAGNQLPGFGNLVLLKHPDRWVTAYAHLDRINVSKGQVISKGQVVGAVGSTGSVTEPQLHFELRRGAEAINPELYL